MSTSIWRYIRNDLRRILLSVPGIPDIAYEMQRFAPVVGVPWVLEAIEKGPSFTNTLGTYGLTQEQAIYLIDLHWPVSGVKSDGEDLADKIRLAFWHGREIASSGPDYIRGRVISSEARRVVVGDVWVVFPVRVTFFVHRATMQV